MSRSYELEAVEFVMLSPCPNERRRSPRLQTVPNQADLEWRDRSQTRSSDGIILNISDHGALVFSDSFPQLGENVLIRLKRPVQSDWTASIVVRHHQQDKVAIDFILGWPYDLELAATLGIDIISSVLGLADRFSNSGDYDARRRQEFRLIAIRHTPEATGVERLWPRENARWVSGGEWGGTD